MVAVCTLSRLRGPLALLLLALSGCGSAPEEWSRGGEQAKGETATDAGHTSRPIDPPHYYLVWGHTGNVSFDFPRRHRLPLDALVDFEHDVLIREGCNVGEKVGHNLATDDSVLLLAQRAGNGSFSTPLANGGLGLSHTPGQAIGLSAQDGASNAEWAYTTRSGYGGFFRLNQYHWARLIQIARKNLGASSASALRVKFLCVYEGVFDKKGNVDLSAGAAEYEKRKAFAFAQPYVGFHEDNGQPYFFSAAMFGAGTAARKRYAALKKWRNADQANKELATIYDAMAVNKQLELLVGLRGLNAPAYFAEPCFSGLQTPDGKPVTRAYPEVCGLEVVVSEQTALTASCRAFLDGEKRVADQASPP
ncbi:MAG: hypothetical protein H6707_00330 [Deltaproteobacteria bacterium]|nr:hypothetical protein [Deltaproteobacteria bacterium]